MKHKYIYTVLILTVLVLAFFLGKAENEKKDLEVVLQQCSDRYYDEMNK